MSDYFDRFAHVDRLSPVEVHDDLRPVRPFVRRSRGKGSNPRARKANARAKGTNPRARGTNPRLDGLPRAVADAAQASDAARRRRRALARYRTREGRPWCLVCEDEGRIEPEFGKGWTDCPAHRPMTDEDAAEILDD